MNTQIAIGFVNTLSSNVASMFAQNIPVMLVIMAALIGLYFGLCKLLKGIGGPGTTSWLGSHWALYDRMTYRPWKGYNRLRSRKWNSEHTL